MPLQWLAAGSTPFNVTHIFDGYFNISHLHGMQSRLPPLYPQTQMFSKVVTRCVHVANPSCVSLRSLHRKGVSGAAQRCLKF